MKLITISKIGYNHPSQANWSYGIWKVDLIDTDSKYCVSHTVKENFGGDSRLSRKLNELSIPNLEVQGVYTSTGTPKITGVAKMLSMEGEELFGIIKDFVKN